MIQIRNRHDDGEMCARPCCRQPSTILFAPKHTKDAPNFRYGLCDECAKAAFAGWRKKLEAALPEEPAAG